MLRWFPDPKERIASPAKGRFPLQIGWEVEASSCSSNMRGAFFPPARILLQGRRGRGAMAAGRYEMLFC